MAGARSSANLPLWAPGGWTGFDDRVAFMLATVLQVVVR